MATRLRGLGAAVLAGVLAVGVSAQMPAAAHSGASAQRECRASVGRPIVQACVRSKLRHVGGQRHHHVASCRADASPAVRACVERKVPHIVAHCRETIGRPLVRACVQNRMQKQGGSPHLFVEVCRMSISWAVRACVSRTALVSPAALGR